MIKSFRALGRFLSRLHLIITIIIVLAIVLTIIIILAFQAREDQFMKHQTGERITTMYFNNYPPLKNNMLIIIAIPTIPIIHLIITVILVI